MPGGSSNSEVSSQYSDSDGQKNSAGQCIQNFDKFLTSVGATADGLSDDGIFTFDDLELQSKQTPDDVEETSSQQDEPTEKQSADNKDISARPISTPPHTSFAKIITRCRRSYSLSDIGTVETPPIESIRSPAPRSLPIKIETPTKQSRKETDYDAQPFIVGNPNSQRDWERHQQTLRWLLLNEKFPLTPPSPQGNGFDTAETSLKLSPRGS